MIGMKKIINGMTTNGTNCKLCNHRRARTESKSGGHALVWGCIIKQPDGKGIRFGYQWEYESGKNMPRVCKDYLKGTL